MYIGSAKDLNGRKINHFSMLRNNTHHSIILQRAYNKSIDKSLFEFQILENCKEKNLIERENFYLEVFCKSKEYLDNINKDFLKISYNILPLAKKGFSGRHRPETIQKMKENHSLRKSILIYKDKKFFKLVLSSTDAVNETKVSKTSILTACKDKTYITKSGYIFCFETDKDDLENKISDLKIEAWNKGVKGLKNIKNSLGLVVKNLQDNTEKIFISQREACEFFKLQPCTVNRCLKSEKPYKKYLKFSYHKI